MPPERRRQPRSNIDILVNKYVNGAPYACRAVNLSRAGMLLHKIFEPDLPLARVEVEFLLPGTDHVVKAAGVALAEHARARAHGVRFVELSDEDGRRIDEFLATPSSSSATA